MYFVEKGGGKGDRWRNVGRQDRRAEGINIEVSVRGTKLVYKALN
jgi:hypothetical protein